MLNLYMQGDGTWSLLQFRQELARHCSAAGIQLTPQSFIEIQFRYSDTILRLNINYLDESFTFHCRGSLRAHCPDQRREGGEGRLRARRLLLGGDDRRPRIVQGGRRGMITPFGNSKGGPS